MCEILDNEGDCFGLHQFKYYDRYIYIIIRGGVAIRMRGLALPRSRLLLICSHSCNWYRLRWRLYILHSVVDRASIYLRLLGNRRGNLSSSFSFSCSWSSLARRRGHTCPLLLGIRACRSCSLWGQWRNLCNLGPCRPGLRVAHRSRVISASSCLILFIYSQDI